MFSGEGKLVYAATKDHQRLPHMAEGDVTRAVSTLRGEVKLGESGAGAPTRSRSGDIPELQHVHHLCAGLRLKILN